LSDCDRFCARDGLKLFFLLPGSHFTVRIGCRGTFLWRISPTDGRFWLRSNL